MTQRDLLTAWTHDPDDDTAFVLRCPVCLLEFNHHSSVTEFYRNREDGPTMAVRLLEGVMTRMTGDLDRMNPSGRRDALRIAFLCESGHRWHLNIVQHKGQTFLEWDGTYTDVPV